MRAAVFKEVGQALCIETVEDPTPGVNEVVIQVKRCGVCGTDLHSTDNHETALPGGTILGHEYSGEVVAIGKEAKGTGNWREGDRLCALPFGSCGNCNACQTGRPFQCELKQIVGMDVGGGFAEYMRIDINNAVKLPQSISWDEGALVEPFAVGLHAVRSCGQHLGGKKVLVVGAGPIGLAVTFWCKFFGARNVVVSEIDQFRLDSAMQFGATEQINSTTENVAERFKTMTGDGPDVIFECVGVPGMISQCIDFARFGSELVIVGFCMAQDGFVPAMAVIKEINMRFAIAYHKQDFEFIVDMIANDRVDVSPMCSGIVGFDSFAEMFESLRSPNQHCKVLLNPFA